MSEETNGESSLNEEQISEVDDEELIPMSEEEPIEVDDPLFEEALREVNEEDRGDELSQTDEEQPSEVEGQLDDVIPAAQPDQLSTPPNSRKPKAPRAPRARQQWEKYSFRGKDGKRWTLQRRVPRERDDTPPNTPLREDSSEEGSSPAKTRRAHPPRTLFFESSDDEDNPTGVGSVASDFASSSRQ